MKTLAALSLVATMITGCAGEIHSTNTVTPEEQCFAHPPLGEVGDPICQSAVGGPSGSTCCSTTKAIGSCEAVYFDGTTEHTAACGSTSHDSTAN